MLFRLNPNYQSPRCFLKIWSLSHMKYPVKVLIFYYISWDTWIKHKEEPEVVCIWTIRSYGEISNWCRRRWHFHLSELVEKFCETGTCRLCSGAAARGDCGSSSSISHLWAGGCAQLWAQLSHASQEYLALCDSGSPPMCELPVVWVSLSYSDCRRMKPV